MAGNPTGGAGGFGPGNGPSSFDASVGRMPAPDPTPEVSAKSSVTASGPSDAKSAAQTEARGAGGISSAPDAGGEDQGVVGSSGAAKKAAVAAAAVPAAQVGGQLLIYAMFINYLKGLLMSLAALATNLLNLAFGLVLAAGKAVVGAALSVGGMVSAAVGGAVSAAAAGFTTFIAGGLVAAISVGVAVVSVSSGAEIAQRDELLPSCTTVAVAALDKIEGSEGSIDGKTMENVKTIYGVLSAWGMPDENIAGIVGNWDAESAVDPTSVQGYFNSPQVMSDEKREAATNTDNGIGLGQWTFGRNAKLRQYATGHGKDWWTLEMQLGFMLSAAEGSDATIVKNMIAESVGTPTEAALHFHDKWERSADTTAMAARRGQMATKWMGLFMGFEKNQALADSILEQSGATFTEANTERAAAVRADCRDAQPASAVLKEGGLTLDEAKELMEVFRAEGESFLQGRYPGGSGPGDCGYGKADNCVGFSTYWVNKFTSFQKYALGNGIDTAGSMARMMGKETTRVPSVYSVASGPGPYPRGHTMIILGIEGDHAIVGEAACGTNHAGTRAFTKPLSELTNGPWVFTDVSDLLLDEPMTA